MGIFQASPPAHAKLLPRKQLKNLKILCVVFMNHTPYSGMFIVYSIGLLPFGP
jgi:hypothetical protein